MEKVKTIKRSTLMKKLGDFIRVENLPSRQVGTAPNQFELTYKNGTVFQSYSTLIGVRLGNQYYFTDSHDYSNTTSGYCSRWCDVDCKNRRKGLANGTYIKIVD